MNGATHKDAGAPRRPDLARFVLAALLAPCVLAIFSVWLGRQFVETEDLRLRARAAFDTSVEAASIITRVADAESSQRGYVLTGDPTFLAPYQPARAAAMTAFDRLDTGLANDPAESAALAQLRGLASRKFTEMEAVIAIRRQHGLTSASARVRGGVGRDLMDRMRRVSTVLVTLARQKREREIDRYRQRLFEDAIWTWTAIGSVGILLLAAAVMIWRQRLSEYRAQVATHDGAERNRAILHNTIDGIVIFDPTGTIETVNTAAAQTLGYPTEDLVGRDVGDIIKLLDRPVTFHQRIGLVDGQIALPYLPDRKVLHSDGHSIPVDIALGVMHTPEGDHVIASVRDISARKRIESMKDELISTVSHELRTPLTSVVGALGLLRSGAAGAIDPAPTRLIEIAENNSRRLIRLINDMLDIDRIQSGQWKFASERIDLRDVISRACEGSQGQAEAADVEIACVVPETPVEVAGDAERLLQVLSNLTSNAIRVSKTGQTVRISMAASEKGKALVTVDDDGPGVPTEFRGRIFGRFERADREHSNGTGLGLAISREIVFRHGGQIWFEDRPGGGTRFAFSLDLLAAPTIAALATPRSRVMIFDDDADAGENLRLMVDGMGFAADRVGAVAAALMVLQSGAYDVLLLDMNLPDTSGATLMRLLRAPDGTLPLPVIVISTEALDRSKAPLDGSIVDWIQKPVDTRRLAAALNGAVAKMPVAA